MLHLWRYCSSSFSSWPKIHFESTWLSTILAVQLRLVCCEAATVLSPVQTPLCDTVLMFLECGTSYSMWCTFHVWWRVIVLYTNNTCTRTQTHTQRCTNSHWHASLSFQLMFRERTPPKPIPWGLVLNKKLLWPTLSEFKIPSWQYEPSCVFRLAKQVLSIQISMFLDFLSAATK